LIDVENWPRCDILISFFSTDFPLFKAVEYVKLRNPVCINDLHAQALLWDRRVVVSILDHFGIPTPRRLIASRDGGAKLDPELSALVESHTGLKLSLEEPMADVRMSEDGEAIIVNGQVMEKPFVEKPVNGEDHNVYIYFKGGQGRRLFRKVRVSCGPDDRALMGDSGREQIQRTRPYPLYATHRRVIRIRRIHRC
jgi:hypothetical protein